jgi:transposase
VRDDCIAITLGLPDVRVIREEETATEVRVEVMYRVRSAPCPRCGMRSAKIHSIKAQEKLDRRLGEKLVWLVLHKRRFRCPGCGRVFSEPDPVFGARRRTSQRLRTYLGREAIHQTIRRVARKEGVGEGLVRRCLTEETKRLLEAPEKPPSAHVLGLDEFAIKKGQVYDTAVVDLGRKRIMGVVSGHRQEEVATFFSSMPNPDQAKVVVMDMHAPFRQAVDLCLPQAKIVVDKFHVLMHIHRALDQVRTSLQPQQGKRGELLRARYLLLKAAERLTTAQQGQLRELLACYPLLRRAWVLKEEFRAWYHCPTRGQAETSLTLWEASVRREGPAPFRGLFPMLRNWRQEILNYFDHPYTNGFLEGKNNRIKVIKRMAYGYRNTANFRQRILLTNHEEAYNKAA